MIDGHDHRHALLPAAGADGASFLAITFCIALQEYGLPVAAVREVVNLPALLPIAGAPPYLRGLLNLRGQFLPVLDGRVLMGAAAPLDLTCQVIVVGTDAPEFGLLVDLARTIAPVSIAAGPPVARALLPILGDVLIGGEQAALLLDIAALRALLEPAAIALQTVPGCA